MNHRLLKVEGAGNDFLLGIGDWARRLADEPDLVARLCDRRRGLGADGVLALSQESSSRVRLIYRNTDGSPSPFCGNGTRCAARVAVELLGLASPLVVETDWAAIPAEVVGPLVTLELPGLEEAVGGWSSSPSVSAGAADCWRWGFPIWSSMWRMFGRWT